jgi:hypothetical protein
MNDELERIWKEAVVAWFKLLSLHLPGGTEEHNANSCHDSRSPGRDLNLRSPEYEAGVKLLIDYF